MKEIAELHWVSMSLFGAALGFVFILVLQFFIRGYDATNPSNSAAIPVKDYTKKNEPIPYPTMSADFWSLKLDDLS